MDGIINVNKEKGMTSFDVLRALRRILREKKMGHTGTLDPMAEGVLWSVWARLPNMWML